MSDARWMAQALGLARLAARRGEVPIGALVVRGGEVLGWGHDAKELRREPAAHAEMIALARAAKRHGDWRLDGAEMFVTLEPCPMCAGALVHARIARLVYAASNPRWGACGSGALDLVRDPRFNHRIEVVAGVMEEECAELLRAFFRAARGGA